MLHFQLYRSTLPNVRADRLRAGRRVVTRLRSYHSKMVEAGYQPIVFEDFMDMLADQLDAINGGADALTLPVRP